jgi:hypothetical protein
MNCFTGFIATSWYAPKFALLLHRRFEEQHRDPLGGWRCEIPQTMALSIHSWCRFIHGAKQLILNAARATPTRRGLADQWLYFLEI